MPENILRAFDTADEAVSAAGELKRLGVPGRAITIMSSEPLHLGEEGAGPRSYVGFFAGAGGLIGAAGAWLLMVWSSRRVGLVTGGMPIVAPWAFGIVAFELAALGVILATFGCVLYEARLLRRVAPARYDPAVADGRVVVAVQCAGDAEADLVRRVFGEGEGPA